nr:transposase [Salinibacter altiplanensis]
MDTAIIAAYCLADDWLQARRHQESPQRKVRDAEIMTALGCSVAAHFFDGNFEDALDLLKGPSYFGSRLSRSRFNRRLHALDSVLESFSEWLGQVHQMASEEDIFLIDSCPVEVSLTPGSYSDTKHLRTSELGFPGGAVLYGDKAYSEYFTEDLLADACEIQLLPHRKKNSDRSVPAYVEYVKQVYCKKIEAGLSGLSRLLPKSIYAVTDRGFELKCFRLCLFAASMRCYRSQLGLSRPEKVS